MIDDLTSKFWNTDISKIENKFLKGRDVTTLPIHLDERVPSQNHIDKIEQPKYNIVDKLKSIWRKKW